MRRGLYSPGGCVSQVSKIMQEMKTHGQRAAELVFGNIHPDVEHYEMTRQHLAEVVDAACANAVRAENSDPYRRDLIVRYFDEIRSDPKASANKTFTDMAKIAVIMADTLLAESRRRE
jgi:hypothetical protein